MKNLIKRIKLKKWQKVDYITTADYYLAKLVHDKTNFNTLDIIVWIARKENNENEFNYFYFQYHGKLYELKNNTLKEIEKIKE